MANVLTHHSVSTSSILIFIYSMNIYLFPLLAPLFSLALRQMASLQIQSITCSSPSRQQTCSRPGALSWNSVRCLGSSFSGQHLRLPRLQFASYRPGATSTGSSTIISMMVKPKIQFIQGTDELTIPDVRLTKSRDGSNGMAIFRFEQPSVFDSSSELGDITGFYMIDEEGVLQSVDVNAKFVNGKPAAIEAKYVMRTPRDWDRFMRFMERYSDANGLAFIKK